MWPFETKTPPEEPKPEASLPVPCATMPSPASSPHFPTVYLHRLHDRREENEREFNKAAAWKIEEVGEGYTVIVSRDFDSRLVIVRKTKIAAYETIIVDSLEGVRRYLFVRELVEDDFEAAGRYLLGAELERFSRGVSSSIPYNPKSTQLAEGWCDAYAVLLRQGDRIKAKLQHTAKLFNDSAVMLNEAMQSYQQACEMQAKLDEDMTKIAKKIGKL